MGGWEGIFVNSSKGLRQQKPQENTIVEGLLNKDLTTNSQTNMLNTCKT